MKISTNLFLIIFLSLTAHKILATDAVNAQEMTDKPTQDTNVPQKDKNIISELVDKIKVASEVAGNLKAAAEGVEKVKGLISKYIGTKNDDEGEDEGEGENIGEDIGEDVGEDFAADI